MSNIVNLGGEPVQAPEKTYDYEFTFVSNADPVVEHGILTLNPVFAATVNDAGRLLYAVPMDQIRSIKRLAPKPALNA